MDASAESAIVAQNRASAPQADNVTQQMSIANLSGLVSTAASITDLTLSLIHQLPPHKKKCLDALAQRKIKTRQSNQRILQFLGGLKGLEENMNVTITGASEKFQMTKKDGFDASSEMGMLMMKTWLAQLKDASAEVIQNINETDEGLETVVHGQGGFAKTAADAEDLVDAELTLALTETFAGTDSLAERHQTATKLLAVLEEQELQLKNSWGNALKELRIKEAQARNSECEVEMCDALIQGACSDLKELKERTKRMQGKEEAKANEAMEARGQKSLKFFGFEFFSRDSEACAEERLRTCRGYLAEFNSQQVEGEERKKKLAEKRKVAEVKQGEAKAAKETAENDLDQAQEALEAKRQEIIQKKKELKDISNECSNMSLERIASLSNQKKALDNQTSNDGTLGCMAYVHQHMRLYKGLFENIIKAVDLFKDKENVGPVYIAFKVDFQNVAKRFTFTQSALNNMEGKMTLACQKSTQGTETIVPTPGPVVEEVAAEESDDEDQF